MNRSKSAKVYHGIIIASLILVVVMPVVIGILYANVTDAWRSFLVVLFIYAAIATAMPIATLLFAKKLPRGGKPRMALVTLSIFQLLAVIIIAISIVFIHYSLKYDLGCWKLFDVDPCADIVRPWYSHYGGLAAITLLIFALCYTAIMIAITVIASLNRQIAIDNPLSVASRRVLIVDSSIMRTTMQRILRK